MKRNCSLELRLVTPPPVSATFDMVGENPRSDERIMTIFYNGTVAVCDMTEFQARAILLLATQAKDEKRVTTPTLLSPGLKSSAAEVAGLSMKRSLKRFLQKRKARAEGVAPYSTQHRNGDC